MEIISNGQSDENKIIKDAKLKLKNKYKIRKEIITHAK